MMWLILGILIGALVLYAANTRRVKLTWLDWVLSVVAIVFFLLAIANYSGSMSELEPRAAGFLLASFGIPGLILAAIVGVRIWRGTQQTSTPAEQS